MAGEGFDRRPVRRNPWSWVTEERLTYALKLLLVITLALYLSSFALNLLGRMFGLLYILVGAIFLAYLVYPAVHALRARLPAGLAIAIVYLALVALAAMSIYLIVPGITNDITSALRHAPQFAARYQDYVENPSDPVLSRLPADVQTSLLGVPALIGAWLQKHGLEAAGHALSLVRGAFAIIATFVIIPLLSIYLLADFDRLRASLLQMLPRDRWSGAQHLLGEIDGVIGGFVRGQLLVAVIVGVLLTVALLILHVPYAFLLGALAALGDLVPYVGAVLTFIPAVGIAAASNGWANALVVAAIFVGIYQLEGHIISPVVFSKQVKLTPLLVLLAVLVGAELGGIFGMLVAVPIAGVLRVILLHLTNQESP